MIRGTRALAALGAVAALLVGVGSASADPATGLTVSNITTSQGSLSFSLTGPASTTIDPNSVTVTSGTTALTAKAVNSGGDRADLIMVDTRAAQTNGALAAAKSALGTYLNSVDPDVKIGLLAYSEKASLVVPPTTDRGALTSAVGGLNASGDTALFDALEVASTAFNGLPADTHRRVLLLSNGTAGQRISKANSSQTISDLQNAKIATDVVAFGVSGDAVLSSVASSTGGTVFAVGDASTLGPTFLTAAQPMRAPLTVTAQVPAALDGKSADITVNAVAADGTKLSTTSPVTFTARAVAPPPVTKSSPDARSWSLLPIMLIVFVAIFACVLIALLLPVLAAERSKRRVRLREVARYRRGARAERSAADARKAQTTSAAGQRALDIADKALRKRGVREEVISDLEGAGLRIRPEEWAFFQLAIVAVGALVVDVVLGHWWGAIIGAAVGYGGSKYFLRWKRNRREAQFLEQIPDTLQLIAGSLRAGFSLPQALNTVVREGTEPTASEFSRALTESRLGADIEDALDDTAKRMNCQDLAWIVIAIRTSREVGGNLAEVIGTTVQTMRMRSELRGVVKALSAEGRISAKVLTSLPFIALGYLVLVNPRYLSPLVHSFLGIVMLVVGGVMLSIGTFWLSRMVKIEV